MNWKKISTGILTKTCMVAAICLTTAGAASAQDTSDAVSRTTSSHELKIVSYNIRLNTPRDGENRWDIRKPKTFEMIRRMNPDLVGLQEALKGQMLDLSSAFPRYKMVGVGRTDGKDGGEFSAIMYDADRLKLLSSDTFWLSDTPEVAGSTTWGNRLTRICTWGLFEIKSSGSRFYMFNTHLDHQSQPSREKSAELIVRRISERETSAPVVLTGDFNAHETNQVIETIEAAGFRDSYRVIHSDVREVGTTNAFSPKRQPAKIDYVFVDKHWEVIDAEIRQDKIDGRWPSDHLPVTATLRLKNQ